MTEELRRLWELRGVDERIGVCRGSLDRFDTERKDLGSRLEGERARVEAVRQRLGQLQVQRRRLETDIDAAAAEERKYQSQLFAVKKNDEYTALLHEIEGAKRRRSDIETRVLELMEQEEASHRERPLAERALQEGEREVAERLARADRDEAAGRGQLRNLEEQRAAILEQLPAALRARYERIHASLDGRAVVPIHKGACGGCFRQQPPQVLQEARRGDRVLACDGCGRLMILPAEAS